jgi:hypothetical protein
LLQLQVAEPQLPLQVPLHPQAQFTSPELIEAVLEHPQLPVLEDPQLAEPQLCVLLQLPSHPADVALFAPALPKANIAPAMTITITKASTIIVVLFIFLPPV